MEPDQIPPMEKRDKAAGKTISNPRNPDGMEQLEYLTRLLDDHFRIPGTQIRFGLDSLAGLIPGIGDAAPLAVSAYIIHRAGRMGASRRIQARMAGNVLIDALIGTIPLLGDIFDVGWKANRRNLNLLKNLLK